MYNVQLMTVLDRCHNLSRNRQKINSVERFSKYLPKIFSSFVLSKPAFVLHDVVVHVAAIAKLEDEVKFGLSVDDLQNDHLEVYCLFSCRYLCPGSLQAIVIRRNNNIKVK